MLSLLYRYEELAPNTPAFEILINKYIIFADGKDREICPIGLIDDTTGWLLELEAMCSEYKTLPFNPPTLDSQPRWVVDAFITIMSAKNKYMERKFAMEQAKAKSVTAPKSN